MTLRTTGGTRSTCLEVEGCSSYYIDTLAEPEPPKVLAPELGKQMRADAEKLRNGAFLGECTIRSLGGQWSRHEDMFCVVLNEGGIAFPHNKVTKQFQIWARPEICDANFPERVIDISE